MLLQEETNLLHTIPQKIPQLYTNLLQRSLLPRRNRELRLFSKSSSVKILFNNFFFWDWLFCEWQNSNNTFFDFQARFMLSLMDRKKLLFKEKVFNSLVKEVASSLRYFVSSSRYFVYSWKAFYIFWCSCVIFEMKFQNIRICTPTKRLNDNASKKLLSQTITSDISIYRMYL